jgi:hypothetical protein
MHLCIWVGAAIADDDQPIIQIAGVANGRQHDAAGVDTGEHQRIDAIGAQQNAARSAPAVRMRPASLGREPLRKLRPFACGLTTSFHSI